jgi:hypothetical protein
MITTNLTGNFGNHMSQLTTLRCIGEKLGYEWGVDKHPTHDYFNGMNQLYFMNVDFGLTPTQAEHEYHEKWPIYNNYNICMFDKEIYNIKDNTILLGQNRAKGGVYQSEEYFYERRNDIFNWYKIKEEYMEKFNNMLSALNFTLDENLCVINFRGGEYKNVANLILNKQYWSNAINHIKTINKNINFLLITDDIECAKKYMPFEIPVLHNEIGFDFFTINQAKYVILSNSSFGLWAGWLNQNARLIIAPKYWAAHNVSDGYWSVGDQYYRPFTYLGRDGKLYSYDECKEEAINYYKFKNII